MSQDEYAKEYLRITEEIQELLKSVGSEDHEGSLQALDEINRLGEYQLKLGQLRSEQIKNEEEIV